MMASEELVQAAFRFRGTGMGTIPRHELLVRNCLHRQIYYRVRSIRSSRFDLLRQRWTCAGNKNLSGSAYPSGIVLALTVEELRRLSTILNKIADTLSV